MEFPKFKYHKSFSETKKAVIVTGLDQEKMLGEDWADSPAHFGIETQPTVPVHIAKDPYAFDPKEFAKAPITRKKKEA